MRLQLAAGLVLLAALPAAAIPPFVPLLPPDAFEEPAEPLNDPAKLAERIEANTKAAADKLSSRDPGADARKAQRQALRDIDELLKQNPPPPMDGGGGGGSPPPPMGGESGSPPPPGGGQPPMGGGNKKPSGGQSSPEKSPGGGQPMPKAGQGQPKPTPGQGQPMPTGGEGQSMPMSGEPTQPGGTQPGKGGTGGKPARPLDDPIAKQVWGHLPDTVRKQMSQYYQEQFMPRYGGLLRDYFSSLAEKDRPTPPVRSPKR